MRIAGKHLEEIISHCRAGLPDEACGVLAGDGDMVSAVYGLENALHSPRAFRLPPDGYLLLAELDEAGQLLGCFHSHPHGVAYPSETDRREAFWPIRYAIVSLAGEQPVLRVFRLSKRDGLSARELASVAEEKVEII